MQQDQSGEVVCSQHPIVLSLLRVHSRVRLFTKRLLRILLRRRALNFTSLFVKDGDLVFDVGANMGDMTSLYLDLGARVVAVEPQPTCASSLRKRFVGNPDVTIVHGALGASPGELDIRLSDIRTPLSSMSTKWIAAVKASGRFPRYEWTRAVPTQVTTLDCLIVDYGLPQFCKIDVEGFEYEVLRGLSHPLPCLSFEYHVEFLESALDCITHLCTLGLYWFNFTVGNRMRFERTDWVGNEAMSSCLTSLPYPTLQGDIYARLDGRV